MASTWSSSFPFESFEALENLEILEILELFEIFDLFEQNLKDFPLLFHLEREVAHVLCSSLLRCAGQALCSAVLRRPAGLCAVALLCVVVASFL